MVFDALCGCEGKKRSLNDQKWLALHRCACGQRGLVLVLVNNVQADSGQRGLVVIGDGQGRQWAEGFSGNR